MSGSDWIVLAVVLVLFLASTLLAVAEMAFARMNRVRALALADEGRRGAARLASSTPSAPSTACCCSCW